MRAPDTRSRRYQEPGIVRASPLPEFQDKIDPRTGLGIDAERYRALEFFVIRPFEVREAFGERRVKRASLGEHRRRPLARGIPRPDEHKILVPLDYPIGERR